MHWGIWCVWPHKSDWKRHDGRPMRMTLRQANAYASKLAKRWPGVWYVAKRIGKG